MTWLAPQVLGEEQVADASTARGRDPHQLAERAALPLVGAPGGSAPRGAARPAGHPPRKAPARLHLVAHPFARPPVGEPLLRSGSTPPAWTQAGSMMRRRVLAHSYGYVSKVTSCPSARASSTSAEDLLVRARHRRAAIEVRHVDRRAAAPPDLDGLPEGVEEPVAQGIADVGVVDPAVSGGTPPWLPSSRSRRTPREDSRAPTRARTRPSAMASRSRARWSPMAAGSAGTSSQPRASIRSAELPTSTRRSPRRAVEALEVRRDGPPVERDPAARRGRH